MPAQIAERVLLEPYCPDCKVFGMDTTVRREAELWVAGHDADNHPEPEGEDG
jgi:hypothetical protein